MDHASMRCAFVTGGNRGIGAEIASRLVHDGFTVAIGYRSEETAARRVANAITQAGGKALPVQIDLLEQVSVDTAFEAIETQIGPVEVLVNNAGGSADGLVLGMEEDAWDRIINLNLNGAYRASRRALSPMLRNRHGRIINVSSIVGPRGLAGAANYAASKAGLEGFTKSLAIEVARRGITVNCVAPGIVSTEMTQDLTHMANTTNLIPMRRAASLDEIAACVSFFARAESSYVTGHTLVVDGGLSAMAFPIDNSSIRC